MLSRHAVSVNTQENFSQSSFMAHTKQTACTQYSSAPFLPPQVANIEDVQPFQEAREALESGLSGLMAPLDPIHVEVENSREKQNVASPPAKEEERKPNYERTSLREAFGKRQASQTQEKEGIE